MSVKSKSSDRTVIAVAVADLLQVLFLILTCGAGCGRCIDPQERIGTCKHVALNVTYYINANEGVWFPQYRSLDLDLRNSTKGARTRYSCHTLFEKVYSSEPPGKDGQALPPWLGSDSYYTENAVPNKEAYSQTYYRSDERGKLDNNVTLPGHGTYKVFNYVLNLTPEYRVRYLCTNYPHTIKSVSTVYIDTRQTFPSLESIREALGVLRRHGLAGNPLVRIRQRNCKRPITMNGYVPMFSTSSTEQLKGHG